MNDQFSPAVSDRICKHMNDDHADAVVLYARVYGDRPDAESAQMRSIDEQGMNLEACVNGETVPVRVSFDRPLADAEDAHHTLVAMLKQARSGSKA